MGGTSAIFFSIVLRALDFFVKSGVETVFVDIEAIFVPERTSTLLFADTKF